MYRKTANTSPLLALILSSKAEQSLLQIFSSGGEFISQRTEKEERRGGFGLDGEV